MPANIPSVLTEAGGGLGAEAGGAGGGDGRWSGKESAHVEFKLLFIVRKYCVHFFS